MRQKSNTWKDQTGKEMPTYAISPVLKLEEKHAQKCAEAALRAEKALKLTVELVFKAYDEIFSAKIAEANMKGNKGNFEGMTFNAFDNSIQVKVTKPDNLYFDNTYTSLVKEKFNEYFNSLKTDSDSTQFLKDLVNDLLYTSGGKLDNSKVLKLRKYRNNLAGNKKMSDTSQLFIEAVDLFDKAIKTKKGNTGIYIEVFDENTKKMRRIALKYTDV
jgi:hypothetical protein